MTDIPTSAFQPEHASIVIWLLIAIVAYLGKTVYDYSNGWKRRLEEKLDKAMENHVACQNTLPEKYLTKQEFQQIFRDHLALRTKEWGEFRQDFKNFTESFWHHVHDSNGKTEVL